MYVIAIDVPIKIDGLFNDQPFNAIWLIIFPTNVMGSNSDITFKKYGCPSIGHINPGIKQKIKLKLIHGVIIIDRCSHF